MRKTITITDILKKKKYMKAHLKLVNKSDMFSGIEDFNNNYALCIDRPSQRSYLCNHLSQCRPDLTKYAIRKALKDAYLKRKIRKMERPDTKATNIPDFTLFNATTPAHKTSFIIHQKYVVTTLQAFQHLTLPARRLFPLSPERYTEFAIDYWKKKGCPMLKKQSIEGIVWNMPDVGFRHYHIKLPHGGATPRWFVTKREIGVFLARKKNKKIGLTFLVD